MSEPKNGSASWLCTAERPGTACSPTKHHAQCRYAGTEPKVQRFTEKQWRLISKLRTIK